MIVVYAQAAEQQGVDAAIDGSAVDVGNPLFNAVREKSKTLNMKPAAGKANRILVHLGLGLVRLQIDASDTEDLSRVVVVIPAQALEGDRDQLSGAIRQTAGAIDRHIEPSDLEAGLIIAARAAQASANQRMLAIGASFAFAALGLIVFVAVKRNFKRN